MSSPDPLAEANRHAAMVLGREPVAGFFSPDERDVVKMLMAAAYIKGYNSAMLFASRSLDAMAEKIT